MLHLGNNLQPRLIGMQNSTLNYFALLPQQVKYSFAPYALTSTPLLIVSVIAPWLTPFALLPTLYLLYGLASRYDATLFTIKQPISHMAYIMPFAGFVSLWGIMLHLSQHHYMMPFLAIYTLLLWAIVRPVFAKWARRVSFQFSFKLLGFLSLIASIGSNFYG